MMNTSYRANWFVRIFVVLTMLWATWAPAAMASPPSRTRVTAPAQLGALPNWWAAPPPAPEREPQPAPLLLPGGSTISGTLTSDDTWGPGVITVTGDITITPGTVITVATATTVQMATNDGLSSGVDTSRIEWIISGTLRADGPVTFTSQAASPAPADWYGLRVASGGQLTLDQTTIEYAIFGVELAHNGPVHVQDSTIRYLTNDYFLGNNTAGVFSDYFASGDPASTILISNTQIYSITGQSGPDESFGGPGMGASAYGIALWSHPITPTLFTPTLQANTIYSITGGRGGDVDMGVALQAGDGGESFGINLYLDGFSPATVVSNTVHHVASGRGGDVTTPAQNAAGGWGHQASGIFVDGGYGPVSVVSNTIYFITGGRGGDGGWDTGLTTGGAGADAMGIGLVSLFHADVRANTVTTVTAGTGGDGMAGPGGTLSGGDPGGDAGPGGYAYGILLDDFVTTTLPIQYNDVRQIRAGAGGAGGDGGDGNTTPPGSDPNGGAGGQSNVGGYAYGILGQWYGVPLTFTNNTAEDIYAGAGGAGGDGGAAENGPAPASGGPGADGSAGGNAYGLYLTADWLSVPTTTVDAQFVSTVWAGAGGNGGLSGWSEDEGASLPGGNGGPGGDAWGILAEQTVALIHNGYVLSIVGGNGGDGNAGNDVSSENMGGGAGPGGAGGTGGRGTGIEVQKDGSLVDPTNVVSVWGGDGGYGGKGGEDDDFRASAPTGDVLGGFGGPGGDGGDAHGCYNNGGARVTFYIVGASQVYGGAGGGGGAGGAACGLHTTGLTPTVELLTTQMIGGGAGGAGGRGGDAQDEISIQQPGLTLGGGLGGAGGAAYGLYNESAGNGGRLYRNETFLVTGGAGGAGGRGGDGTETVPVALALFGSWGGDGGPGGDGWGLQNLAVTATLVARTTAYTITGGSAGNGGDGGDVNYVSAGPGTFPPGDGGMGGLGGDGYGVDSDARMENNLAYRVYGGSGGSGGDSGFDQTFMPPLQTALGGAGGAGGDGVTLGATNGIPLFNNTAAKTQGGAGGYGGIGAVLVGHLSRA